MSNVKARVDQKKVQLSLKVETVMRADGVGEPGHWKLYR